MSLKSINNIIIDRDNDLPLLFDVFFDTSISNKPVVIFSHGYKGYKDWGAWNLIAEEFVKQGFIFVKFNFSHNGGTVDNPIDFPDLEAFGNNTYSKELNDLGNIIDSLNTVEVFNQLKVDTTKVFLIGHSRGGGISILKASQDNRIKKLCTWAAVSNFGSRFLKDEELEKWKNEGIMFVENGRTKQQMPHYFSFYEDYQGNESILNISKNLKNIDIPTLIIHGKNDKAVSFSEAEDLNNNIQKSELYAIDNTGHTFDAVHPWEETNLPKALKIVVDETISFFKDVKD